MMHRQPRPRGARPLLALFVLLVSACLPTPAASTATVTLGLYSGRPDPSWQITPAQAAALLRDADAAPARPPAPAQGDRLGYRGVRLVVTGAAGAELAAYNGVLSVTRNGTATVHNDPGRALERRLLETGVATIEPAQMGELLREFP